MRQEVAGGERRACLAHHQFLNKLETMSKRRRGRKKRIARGEDKPLHVHVVASAPGEKNLGKEEAVPDAAVFEKKVPLEEFPVAAVKDDSRNSRPNFFQKMLSLVSGVLVFASFLSVAAAAYFFLWHRAAPRDVVFEIEAPKKSYYGAPFDVSVKVSNVSNEKMYDAAVWLELPPDFQVVGADGSVLDFDKARNEIKLGDLDKGTVQRRVFRVLSTALEGDSEKDDKKTAIVGKLSYGVNKNSNFEISDEAEVSFEGPAVQLEVKSDDKVVSGSAIALEIVYKNVSDTDFDDVAVRIDYPGRFVFISSDLQPSSLNNYWKLGGLRKGSKGSIRVQGRIEGQEGVSFDFPTTFYIRVGDKDYPIYKSGSRASIAPSPLGLDVLINGASDKVVHLGDSVRYSIQYANSSGVLLQNVVIRATVRGDMVDFSTLETDGELDTIKGQVVWDGNKVVNLSGLQPGERGQVYFSVKLPNKFPINRYGDKNFSIKVNVSASSPSTPHYLSGGATKAEKEVVTKIGGSVMIDAKGFYRDASSGFVNSGQLPPRVGEATQYTIHWVLRNFSTDINGVKVSAVLPQGVKLVGSATANVSSVPQYDANTNSVVWEIDRIEATRGAVGAPIEGVFQIEAIPEAQYAGSFQPLLGVTNLTATDSFTGEALSATDLPISTNLLDDTSVLPGQGVVTGN